MNKRMKRQMLIGITVIISLVIIIIGGKAYIDKREERKAQELLIAEKESVQALKNIFANILEVKIEHSGYFSMTGSYDMFVTMTNTKQQSVYFSYGFGKHSREILDYGIEDRSIQTKGITKNKIKVIYSNGEEDYV
ncbi:hypothetical protein [Enterococcus mundtii]|uniref:DUF1310 domain-containing protein n=2 Tax=Enterococcus mundtii TaxID=53346 RepID=A0ABQ0V9H5_ENTMU|nr:hypothetical protein [Enterococcus mundtii]GEN17679.1 hypothetical protein LAC02_09600 [Ligilactobacillus acidipiscis]AUB52283.1 hypothetical protein EM4838_04560 [Enterococcus mundtii]MZZ58165.1 hypothetical protein [Enterococcus mundtii]MZZ61140.1 hypothetical protein [Enterococcus mundtii]MZZ68125.1 hypothetical protein [Enterococcus mundtii]